MFSISYDYTDMALELRSPWSNVHYTEHIVRYDH